MSCHTTLHIEACLPYTGLNPLGTPEAQTAREAPDRPAAQTCVRTDLLYTVNISLTAKFDLEPPLHPQVHAACVCACLVVLLLLAFPDMEK